MLKNMFPQNALKFRALFCEVILHHFKK